MTRAAARVVRAAGSALVIALLGAALIGVLGACGASPTALGPTGIDGLTIPTPSPDPADFSDRVDNPWFPLAPGTVWTYRQDTTTSTRDLVAGVLPELREIAGVATTGVRWQAPRHGHRVTVLVRWYAEDHAGNVWWFGQDVRRGPLVDDLARRSWAAGEDGAEAGLVLSADPRVGDGYANAEAPRVVERRSTVVSLTATVATTNRTYHDTVLTRDQSSLDPTQVTQSFFARAIGLVAQQITGPTTSELTLLRVRHP
jgi:hypothetical protein